MCRQEGDNQKQKKKDGEGADRCGTVPVLPFRRFSPPGCRWKHEIGCGRSSSTKEPGLSRERRGAGRGLSVHRGSRGDGGNQTGEIRGELCSFVKSLAGRCDHLHTLPEHPPCAYGPRCAISHSTGGSVFFFPFPS